MPNISYPVVTSPFTEIDLIEQVKESIRDSLAGYIGQEWGRVVHSEMVNDVVYYQMVRPLHHIRVNVTVRPE